MAFVVDASVTLPWFLEDERSAFTDAVFATLHRGEFWTAAIWCLEFPNALLAAQKRRRIDRIARLGVLERAVQLGLRIEAQPPDLRAVSAVAEQYGLSTYDAAYLELAMRQGFGLITLDRHLADATIAAGVPLQAPGRSGAAQRRRRYNV
jgi:predicted nucleic acid-binding protein